MVVRWLVASLVLGAPGSGAEAVRPPLANAPALAASRVDPPIERAPGRAGPALHLRLSGDLDSMACVERLRVRLDEARADRAALLVLEIDANRTRPDVLLALADAIRAAEIPTVGFLIDERDRRVSPTALALALAVGDRVAIDPQTAIRHERGDWRDDLLPEDIAPPEAIEEFRMAVQRALAAREIDPTLANAWLPDLDAAPTEAIDPGALAAVGIDAVIADSVSRVARAVGHRASIPRAEVIDSALEPARAQVDQLLTFADSALEETRRGLDLRNQRPDQREVSVHDHRRAGSAALDRLALASEGVDRAEALLREYPELLLAAPPGRTDVGTTRYTLRSAWRKRLDDLREDIEYWRERAKDSASR